MARVDGERVRMASERFTHVGVHCRRGKDFTDYYYYCFNRQGALIRVERQFRTAWRWGFTETISYDDKGNEEERTSNYFDTKNEQAIEPPEKSDLVTPSKIFRTVSSLPFFALLSAKDKNQAPK
jgi:hypothetical protein